MGERWTRRKRRGAVGKEVKGDIVKVMVDEKEHEDTLLAFEVTTPIPTAGEDVQGIHPPTTPTERHDFKDADSLHAPSLGQSQA